MNFEALNAFNHLTVSLERSSDLSTVFSLNAVKFGLVLFILHPNCPSLTSKKDPIRETSPNSLYQNPIRSNAFHVNNGDKTVHQQAGPPTLYAYLIDSE